MKKVILTTLLTLISIFSYSQEWKFFDNKSSVLIQTSTNEYHDNVNDLHQQNILVMLTNTSLLPKTFSYTIETTYGEQTIVYNKEGVSEITLGVNESVILEPIFVKFLPNRDGRIFSQTKLTNLNIVIE